VHVIRYGKNNFRVGAEALSPNEFSLGFIRIFGIHILTFGQFDHFTISFGFLEKMENGKK
jgi:hypothetical protein